MTNQDTAAALVAEAVRDALEAADVSGREISRRTADALADGTTPGTIQTLLSRMTTHGRGLTGRNLVAVLDVLEAALADAGQAKHWPTVAQVAANVAEVADELDNALAKQREADEAAALADRQAAGIVGMVQRFRDTGSPLFERSELLEQQALEVAERARELSAAAGRQVAAKADELDGHVRSLRAARKLAKTSSAVLGGRR